MISLLLWVVIVGGFLGWFVTREWRKRGVIDLTGHRWGDQERRS